MRILATLLLLASSTLVLPERASATPFHAGSSGRACDTCHIEPTGWKNPDVKLRECTLDCSGCHTNPTGGGIRTPAGQYYGLDQLATWGPKPRTKGNPEKNRAPGDPSTKGRFRLWEGFEGWQAGTTPMETIHDRFGDINPDPRFRIGGDFRAMAYFPEGEDASYFPMQTDLYGMVKAADHLRMYATLGYLGRRTVEPQDRDWTQLNEILAVREAFAQVDGFPYGAYVRGGRFNKPHGWRIPDHTSFIRRDLGYDQNAQAFGVEAGFNANYPYANVMLFYQGSDFWPGDRIDGEPLIAKGYGASMTAGYRGLAGQFGLSATALDYERGGHEFQAGPIWAVNAYPFVYLGQVDFRSLQPEYSNEKTTNQLFAYHEVDLYVYRGIGLVGKYDWMDENIAFKDDHRHRYTAGVEWNPYNRIQLVLQRRWAFRVNRETETDTLFMTHYWF